MTLQVGQCGNQVGCRFWDLILREHVLHNRVGMFNQALSAYFTDADARCGASSQDARALRARAVLVDMEEGVVAAALRGPLRTLFDRRQIVTNVSGSGNNWAHGHEVYGPVHRDVLVEAVRRAAGSCDSLQCFSVVHSLGGGTGSGLGTYLLRAVKDELPGPHRFVTAVFPSDEDDVVTSPYNALLATAELIEHADAVPPGTRSQLVDLDHPRQTPHPHTRRCSPWTMARLRKWSIVRGASAACRSTRRPLSRKRGVRARSMR